MDLLASGRGTGYLLKGRVTDVDEFLDAGADAKRRLGGRFRIGSELFVARHRADPLSELSDRDREVPR